MKAEFIRCRINPVLKDRFEKCLEQDGLTVTDWIISRLVPYVESKEGGDNMAKKPDYCTQNNGKCSSCSLTNYNRDCHNNPIKK